MAPTFIQSLQFGFMAFCLIFFPVLATVLVLFILTVLLNNEDRIVNRFFKSK